MDTVILGVATGRAMTRKARVDSKESKVMARPLEGSATRKL